jgi:hypothetical protein
MSEQAEPRRDSLAEIPKRHRADPWTNALFISLTVLVIALAIGAVTSKAVNGAVPIHQWTVQVEEHPEILKN